MDKKEIKEYVKERYGDIAQSEQSCCPSCACTSTSADIASQIGYSEKDLNTVPNTSNMGLGCGNPVALANLKEGEIVLDLGSGGGIDVFLAANKVGTTGKVIGVDMTIEMIHKAQTIANNNNYENVEFRLGEIEKLPIDDNSIDIVISNCVINLSPDKEQVFREIYRVLKPNGRVLISDIVTEGILPEEIRKDFTAWADCIAGALEKHQYLDVIRGARFKNIKIISESTYTPDVPQNLNGKITSLQVKAYKNIKN